MAYEKITIYDIAREAKVSPATVSRILTGSAKVNADKKERVMKLVAQYDFRPSALAKGLSQTHSKLIGMMCPDVRNPYYANIFVECEHAAFERGYTLILNNTFADPALETQFIQKMLEQRAEGILICGGVTDWRPIPKDIEHLLLTCAEKIPVVLCGDMPLDSLHQVNIDHTGGMQQAVRHLSALGHRRIAFIHGFERAYQTQEKTAAFRDVMASLNLPIDERYIVDSDTFDEHGGKEAMKRLLLCPELPTAVVATNDTVALGAMQEIHSQGYSVPKDISVIGCDNIGITELSIPRLTSVGLDYAFVAQKMIDLAIAAIESGAPPARTVIPMQLFIKGSCARLTPRRARRNAGKAAPQQG